MSSAEPPALDASPRYVTDQHAVDAHRHEGDTFIYPWDEAQWPVAPHPGENHEFRTLCYRCGERGILNVALITPGETVAIREAT